MYEDIEIKDDAGFASYYLCSSIEDFLSLSDDEIKNQVPYVADSILALATRFKASTPVELL